LRRSPAATQARTRRHNDSTDPKSRSRTGSGLFIALQQVALRTTNADFAQILSALIKISAREKEPADLAHHLAARILQPRPTLRTIVRDDLTRRGTLLFRRTRRKRFDGRYPESLHTRAA
jgi:hypothetical protein